MATKRNFMLKVVDTKMGDIRKTLKEAGIDVVSIIEIHKEDMPEQPEAKPEGEADG